MPKAPNQKYKLFYILELLRSESDEKHPVTMPANHLVFKAEWYSCGKKKCLFGHGSFADTRV